MRWQQAFALAALFTTTIGQSGVSTISGSATASLSYLPEYNTDLDYNTNTSPVPVASVFTYTSGSEIITSTLDITASAPASTGSSNATTTRTGTGTLLQGTNRASTTSLNGTASASGTASRTSAVSQATNTQPCNGYAELCDRRFSNITHVAAHNSPFSIPNNVASNQALDVTTQLNDGIRMLQFQVHKPNASSPLVLCHSSCDLLYAGTLVDYLVTVREWLEENRYEVITILMGNNNYLEPGNFTAPVIDSGLLDYAYIPDTQPMFIDAWPTLAEMILTNKRVVFMLDYDADQASIPWLLDEFSYVWETPFSPTDRDFPCTADRPEDQPREFYEQRMSLANHNLNIAIAFGGFSIDVPAYNLLNETNAVEGYGSAGVNVANCTAEWGRPPTFLLVDFYNIGSFNGSVMAVAAAANNLEYNEDSCCGTVETSLATGIGSSRNTITAVIASALLAVFLMA